MRVLVCASFLARRSGSELYVVEVVNGLVARGLGVTVYSPRLGPVADLVDSRATVTNRLRAIRSPDVVLAQGPVATSLVLDRFPTSPVVLVSHDHNERWPSTCLLSPVVVERFGVSRVCVEALLEQGAAPGSVSLLANFVDTGVFARRPALPAKPGRALVFSNYAQDGGWLEQVREGCAVHGLPLDVRGAGVGAPLDEPSALLGAYDVVFAKGRAALEAAATGCAVVLCDFAGLGPMVSLAEYEELRAMNFGFEALTAPHTREGVVERLAAYDATDAAAVTERLRVDASLIAYVDDLVTVLHAASTALPAGVRWARTRGAPRAHLALSRVLLRLQGAVPDGWRDRLRGVTTPIRRLTRSDWRPPTVNGH